MERRYRESEKKIHKSPYVDPGEISVDLPQDIIRQGGDLILLKKPIHWNYPEGYFSDSLRSGSSPGGTYGVGGRFASSNGSGGGGGGVGAGSGSKFGYGSSTGSAHYGAGGYGSPYSRGGFSSSGHSEGYHSGVNSGHSINNDYAAPFSRHPVAIKRSASHGDSSNAFTPALSDEYSSSRVVSLSSPQKHAGVSPFPVSPADARLSSWATNSNRQLSPGGSSTMIVPGGTNTTTTEYKRMYQSSVSTRTTANGAVTFNQYQNQHNQEQGKYYS